MTCRALRVQGASSAYGSGQAAQRVLRLGYDDDGNTHICCRWQGDPWSLADTSGLPYFLPGLIWPGRAPSMNGAAVFV